MWNICCLDGPRDQALNKVTSPSLPSYTSPYHLSSASSLSHTFSAKALAKVLVLVLVFKHF